MLLILLIIEPVFQPEQTGNAYTARYSAAMIDNQTLDALKAISLRCAGKLFDVTVANITNQILQHFRRPQRIYCPAPLMELGIY